MITGENDYLHRPITKILLLFDRHSVRLFDKVPDPKWLLLMELKPFNHIILKLMRYGLYNKLYFRRV